MIKYILKLVILIFISKTVLVASFLPIVDAEYASQFSKLLVQSSDGRIKPMDTQNIDLLNKLIGKTTFKNLSYNQVFLSMSYFPNVWKSVPMFDIVHPNIKKLIDVKNEKKYYSQFYDQNGNYILEDEVKKIQKIEENNQSSYEKELLKLDEKIKIAGHIYTKGFMRIYPLKNSINHTWYSPVTLKDNFYNETKYEAQLLFVINKNEVKNALYTKNWIKAKNSIDNIQKFQMKYADGLYLSENVITAELFYNKILIFEKLYPLYLFLGFLLFVLMFVSILRSKEYKTLTKIFVYVIGFTFVLHLLGLGLRWYISTYAPWSNAYESMLFISLCITFAGLTFAQRSLFALAGTSFLSGVLLFVAHLSWLDPQIYTLAVNLQSIWLTIHVAVISSSYGFLALCALLGIITLLLLTVEKKSKSDISKNINKLFKINEISMIIGLSLLAIGTLLGSVWANEAWGRIWGWDPKETWSLISILIYMLCLHIRFVPKLYSVYIFSVASVVCYSTIIMTYFGVNYFFDAIHVYASKSGSEVPTFTYYVIGAIIVLISLSFKNRKYKC